MDNLDLIDLKRNRQRVTLPPAKDDEHWRPDRLRWHMAGAIPTGLATGARRRVPRIWRMWMTAAALVLASTLLAIAVLWLMRKAL